MRIGGLIGILALSLATTCLAANFRADVSAASDALEKQFPAMSEKMTVGDLDGANRLLLDVFPEATRTPAQTFLLGNTFFDNDPKLSYALHKKAAGLLPDEPAAQWEWTLEQHRAGEYAGALPGYDAYLKLHPDSPGTQALRADCLIRLGRVAEACQAWRISEDSKSGSIEAMEEIVCAVHSDACTQRRRVDLLAKARTSDVDAAVALVALDSHFERDWWNAPPAPAYLKNDIQVIRAAHLKDADRMRAIECVAACSSNPDSTPADTAASLRKYGFIIDPNHTLPVDGSLMAYLSGFAIESGAMTDADARTTFAEPVLATARRTNDVEYWNAVLHFADPSKLVDLEAEAWAATGDPRFAIGSVYVRQQNKQAVHTDDSILAAALSKYPENADLLAVAVTLAAADQKLTDDLFVQAIKAEFHHFSSAGVDGTQINLRPRATRLRKYFAALGRRLPH